MGGIIELRRKRTRRRIVSKGGTMGGRIASNCVNDSIVRGSEMR